VAVKKISISVPPGLVKVMDSEAKKQGINRSQLATRILIDHLYIPCPTCGKVRQPDEEHKHGT